MLKDNEISVNQINYNKQINK